ncbi:hypothetical protein Hte_004726 [Hypoxylon texense]
MEAHAQPLVSPQSMNLQTPSKTPTKLQLRCSLQSIHHEEQEPHDVALSKKWLPKAVALCRELWPSAKHDTLSVKYLSHGSYNTVFSISIVLAGDEPAEYVLRIPDDDQFPITRTAAILEYLTQSTDLKVPRVITWDVTTDNPLENGYVILARIPGKCLQEVWEDLTHGQKLALARELAQQLLQIESVTNPIAGTIKVHEKGFRHGDDVSDRIFIEALGAETEEMPGNPINWSNSDNGLLPLDRLRHDPPNLSVNDIMLALFKRRIYQANNHESPHDGYLSVFEFCQDTVEDLVKLRVFEAESDTICLHHADLFPRNIMVDFSPDITITGILDWDLTLFVPRFAGRISPRWLWRSVPQNDSEYYKFDKEPLEPEGSEPDSPENAEIKRAFEDAVGESWVAEATGKCYPIARKLLKLARDSRCDGEDIDSILSWTKTYESLLRGTSNDLDDSDDSDVVMDVAIEDDAGSYNQQDDKSLMEVQEIPSITARETPEHEGKPTDIEVLEYDSLECSSDSDSKDQETIQSAKKEPVEEDEEAEAQARRAWNSFRSLLANLPEDQIQIPRHVDSSMKAIQDWLESQSTASLDQGHSDRELSMTHVRDCLEGTQKCPVVSTSATTGKKKLTPIITKLTRKHDGNASWMGAIRDWASSFLRISLKIRPAVPEIPTTTTRQHENPKGSPESS